MNKTKTGNKTDDKLMTKNNENVFGSYKSTSQLSATKAYNKFSKYFNIKLDVEINSGKTLYVLSNTNNTNNNNGVIKKIEDLGYIDDYVYDLETENHHFGAGVGEIIVHNTDSSMPDIGITYPTKAYAAAKLIAAPRRSSRSARRMAPR